jgi:hypothetical protein
MTLFINSNNTATPNCLDRGEKNVADERILSGKLPCWDTCHFLLSLIKCRWLPLWSSSKSFWLHIQRSEFDSRSYQIFWEVVGLERGPFSLVSTIEELLERKSNGSGLESREYGCRDPSRCPRGTLYPWKLALTSPTSGGHSVGIVRSRTQATEFIFFIKCRNTVVDPNINIYKLIN